MESEVNDALAKVFLGGRFEGRPLYLVLDNQGRARLAELLGKEHDEVEDYCCAETGKQLDRTGDPFSKFEQRLWRWSLSPRRGLPPFLDLLFTLSHAAEQMVSDGDFTAGNFYDRLASIVNFPSQRLQLHGKTTEQFWRAFNKWLADNDFSLGRPTARAINANKYVSIAMSQAIVREADRKRFHLMFEKYPALASGQATGNEIEQYLSAWMRTSQPTRQLKEAWKKVELRSRVAEAAVGELAEWQEDREARGAAGGREGSARLSLAVKLGKELFGRSMSIYLGRAETMDPVTLIDNAGGQVELANWTFGAFATLEPRSGAIVTAAMSRGVSLASRGGKTYAWNPRPVMVFTLNEQGLWIESGRVSLNTPHLVLVRDEKFSREAVESALEEIALPGYQRSSAGSLKGLPAGWIAYEGVVITRALSDYKGFEIVLSPVGDVASLHLEGGMRLGRDIWHSWMPPVAAFLGEKAPCSIEAFEGTDDQGQVLCKANEDASYVELDLAKCTSRLDNVFVQARAGKAVAATASLLFRSANRPRVLDRQARGKVRLTGVISSTVGGEEGHGLVRGLLVPREGPVVFDEGILSRLAKLGSVVGRHKQEAEMPAFPQLENALARKPTTAEEFEAMTCAERGRHLPRYEAVLPGTPRYAPVDVECRKCGESWVHRRPRPARKDEAKPKAIPRVQGRREVSSTRKLDVDLCLDGAGFLGTGSTANIETFVEAQGVDSWRAGVVLKHLSWLGHLDVESGNTYRPRSWSVAPPSISMIGEERGVLAGFRSQHLVDSLTDAVESAGGSVEIIGQEEGPRAILVSGLDRELLPVALELVTDSHSRKVAVVDDVPLRLLGFLGERKSLVDLFKPVTIGNGLPLQRYDVAANKWRNAESPVAGGAYRVSGAGTNYVFVAPSGKAHAGPHELVKLAAARVEGLSIHAYDPSTRSFTSRLGCEPIGLLSRAVVGCSGQLPRVEDSTSISKNVSPAVAAGILSWLYEGELPA